MMYILGALVILACLASANAECQAVHLESWNWQYASQVPSNGQFVTSMTLTSVDGGQCNRDETFGFEPFLMWVDHGCRAWFEICFEPYECSNHLLESWNWAYARYTIQGAARILSMTMTEAQSPADICIEGDTYDFMGVDAYVDDGCRARFDICYQSGNSDTVRCQSINQDQKICDVGCEIKSAVLQTALSDDPCVRDFSFFIEETTIVTKRGCRADFIVGT